MLKICSVNMAYKVKWSIYIFMYNVYRCFGNIMLIEKKAHKWRRKYFESNRIRKAKWRKNTAPRNIIPNKITLIIVNLSFVSKMQKINKGRKRTNERTNEKERKRWWRRKYGRHENIAQESSLCWWCACTLCAHIAYSIRFLFATKIPCIRRNITVRLFFFRHYCSSSRKKSRSNNNNANTHRLPTFFL